MNATSNVVLMLLLLGVATFPIFTQLHPLLHSGCWYACKSFMSMLCRVINSHSVPLPFHRAAKLDVEPPDQPWPPAWIRLPPNHGEPSFNRPQQAG
jgi:hypothetical protein